MSHSVTVSSYGTTRFQKIERIDVMFIQANFQKMPTENKWLQFQLSQKQEVFVVSPPTPPPVCGANPLQAFDLVSCTPGFAVMDFPYALGSCFILLSRNGPFAEKFAERFGRKRVLQIMHGRLLPGRKWLEREVNRIWRIRTECNTPNFLLHFH